MSTLGSGARFADRFTVLRLVEGGHAELDAHGLTVEHPHEGWIGAHEQGWDSRPYARVPVAALPMDAAVFRDMMRAIAGAASSYRASRTWRRCSCCGSTLAATDMHDDATCHACEHAR